MLKNDINNQREATPLFCLQTKRNGTAYSGNHYLARFTVDGTEQTIDVYAKDDTDAKNKVAMLYPVTAADVTVSSGAPN